MHEPTDPTADFRPGPLTVLYDGPCAFCRGAVGFAFQRARPGRLRFVPRQSAAGAEVLARCGLAGEAPDALVASDGIRCYTHSTAALQVARRLRAPWRFLTLLALVPRPVRDAVYGWIARRRHRLAAGPTPD